MSNFENKKCFNLYPNTRKTDCKLLKAINAEKLLEQFKIHACE